MNKITYTMTILIRLLATAFVTMAFVSAAYSQNLTSINFREADINSLIETVAEITGRSFVIDPRVRGNVTIITPNGIESDMLYEAFLSALQVNGFQAVEDGAVVRIVPFNQAFGVLGGGSNQVETRLIKINNVDAQSLLPAIRPLLGTSARIQAFTDSNYLIVTDIEANVERLVELVSELDDPSQNALEVIELNFISPGEAVYIVGQLQQSQQGLSIVEDSLNNRVIISGPSATRVAFRNMLQTLDTPTSRSAGVEVIFLDYALAEDLKEIVEGVLLSQVFLQLVGDSEAGSKSSVQVDASNNALIIAASPDAIKEIKRVIEELDRLKPQVLIEVIIAELSEDQAERLSAQLVYSNRNTGAALTNFDNLLLNLLGLGLSAGDSLLPSTSNDVSPLAVLNQVQGGVFGAGNFDAEDGTGFGVLIEALKSDSSTRVLSTPSIVTLDNEEAELSVGAEIPFITGSFTTSVDGASNPFQTIEREDVGIKLIVTPQISGDNIVRLSIDQESSNVIGSASQLGTADVITSKSTITTNVMVADGELLILGGLINNQFENKSTKVPLLGSIPILGHLFKSSSDDDEQRVLMMFIRPTILDNMETATDFSAQRYDYLINHELSGSETKRDVRSLLQEFIEE